MEHVTSEQVIYQPPCYILCAGCDYRIEGQDANEVVRTADRYGWRIFRGHPYCEQCQERNAAQIERYQRGQDKWARADAWHDARCDR